jgi:voltage-gated potassium channel
MTVRRSASSIASGVRDLPIFAGRPILIWAALVIAAASIGTGGYVILFGWTLSDAFYMTMITLTTVGFREVAEVTEGARLWTILIAMSGVGLIFGFVGLVAEAVVASATSGRREQRRMTDAIERLEGHWIVCGYGRVGSAVARELAAEDQAVVVIDPDGDSREQARRDRMLVVEDPGLGDATDDAALRAAGIDRARGLVATTDSDGQNVYVILSARTLNQGLFIVGRASTDAAVEKLSRAGADRVVSPYQMAGRRLAALALRPRVVDFLDAAVGGGVSFALEEVEVGEDGPLAGRSVGDLEEREVRVLAIVRDGREQEPNPASDRKLEAGDILIVVGPSERLDEIIR